MCFYTKGSKLRIATKDIKCNKSVIIYEDYCVSSWIKFIYEYNKKYSSKSKLTLFLRWLFNDVVESEGYHSYVPYCHTANVNCIIPKGSLYIINTDKDEYCSTSIIIKNY